MWPRPLAQGGTSRADLWVMEQLEAEKLQRARRWALLVPVRAREAFCSRRRPSTPVSGTDVTEVVLRGRETELTPPSSLSQTKRRRTTLRR